jgi:ATP diphosphatase
MSTAAEEAAMSTKARRSVDDLLAVMAALRTPGTGCQWDLEQDFKSIAPYTIEEAYEVADAIERGDLSALRDELGDLLLQVVYHARIAEERDAFRFTDVVEAIAAKMLRRHPHVFGTPEERAAGAAPGFWERIKAAERAEKPGVGAGASRSVPSPVVPKARTQNVGEGQGGGDSRTSKVGVPPTPGPSPQGGGESGRRLGGGGPAPSVLDGVPLALPALTRAVKLQNKAARVGFDWPSLAPVFDKLKEELTELEDAVAPVSGPPGLTPSHQAKVEEEFGDLLFVVANVARHLRIDPEAALRAANHKFTRRFHGIERKLAEAGRTPAQSTLAEMDRLWDEAKADEGG